MKLLLIDGNSIMNRAFYGIRMLTNKKGEFTNALTGFMNIYLKLLKEEQPDHIAAAFDLKAPTFRHKMFDGYKANRHGMPDELAQQMPVIRELLPALGVTVVEKEGFEADDIIGTLSRAAAENGAECVIMTGDRDSFQLINDKVTVRLASNKEDIFYTPEKIMEVYGVTPLQMIEVKTLMGDTSDNIPGVAGIGEKTALSLIQKYGSVQYIYDNIDTIDVTNGVRNKLINGRDNAELSRKLAVIELHAPVSEQLSDYAIGETTPRAAEILTEKEMFSVMKKLSLEAVPVKSEPVSEAAEAVTGELDEGYEVAIVGDELRAYRNGKLYGGDVAKLLADKGSAKRTADAKALYAYCMENGIALENVVFDTTLAAYLLNVNSGDYEISRLCAEYGVTYDEERLGQSLYLLNAELFRRICSAGMLSVLQDIEIPLAEVLSSMERDGIAVDKEALHAFGEELKPRIASLEAEIHEMAGHSFNVGSPKQLSVVLFEEMKLPGGKKRKTGWSTDAETLEKLTEYHPIAEKVLEYRSITKLYNTYVKGYEGCVAEDGRMHTTFKQTETRTGRISSADPNIQNIPVRTELGRNFRRFFVAGEGKTLVDADYSQIELRVLAHIAKDEAMIKTFCEGGDIHTETAASVFGMPAEWVTSEMRRSAKAVNFGMIYGMEAFSLAKDIGTSLANAKQYMADYFAHYSGVKTYMEGSVAQAEKDGYAVTMFGRRRFIPEMLNSNKMVKAQGKRMAMNAPIQGTAADIIKIAMIKVFRRLKEQLPEARLILQVHDELIVEAPEAVADKAALILREEMEGAVKLSVPLIADAKEGKSWYDAH